MRRAVAVLSMVCAVGLTAGCGEDETAPADSAASSEPTSEPSDRSSAPNGAGEESEDAEEESEGTSIAITVADGSISPSGERVDVAAGEEIELVIKSDTAGELHVHTFPDQVLEFGSGTTTHKLTIDEPGVVEVEDHHSGMVVVQLEVR